MVEARYNEIMATLDKVELWTHRITLALVILAFLVLIVVPFDGAYAQDGTPPDEAASNLVGIFTRLAKLFIKVMYGLIMLAFAVGSVKAGLGAQAATAFGLTGRVSMEMMSLVGGIIVFAIAVMALPLANMIIDTVTESMFGSGFEAEIHNPFAP
jgi:hypothetical protein